jgi:hypothetical protein
MGQHIRALPLIAHQAFRIGKAGALTGSSDGQDGSLSSVIRHCGHDAARYRRPFGRSAAKPLRKRGNFKILVNEWLPRRGMG